MTIWVITVTRDDPKQAHLYRDFARSSDTAAITDFLDWCESLELVPVDVSIRARTIRKINDAFDIYRQAAEVNGWRVLFRIVAVRD